MERMRSETREYRTGDRDVVLDLTRDCEQFVAGHGDGLLNLFVPHATAGIAILETGAGSDDDLLSAVERLLADDPLHERMAAIASGLQAEPGTHRAAELILRVAREQAPIHRSGNHTEVSVT